MSGIVEQARLFVERGDVHAAARELKHAEEAGDATAARELATWCLTGQLIRRDLAAARALFERAAFLGDQPSARIVRAFLAVGVGGPASWLRSIELLRAAALTDEGCAAELRLIEAMQLTDDGEPDEEFSSDLLSEAPEIRLFRGLFSSEECAFLVHVATPLMQPSTVIDPQTGAMISNPVRTADAAAFPFVLESPAIHALNRRIAKASGTNVRQGEPLQVLRYRAGQQYRAHFDAFAPSCNQRILTFLVWLNEDYEGGETHFEEPGLNIRGRRGDGLLFRNAHADGRPDQSSRHAGLPVRTGEKIIASRWIRQRPLVIS